METQLIFPQKTSQTSRLKNRFTAGYTYFQEPERLEEQIKVWQTWPDQIDIFIVDDGSEIFEAYEILKDVWIPDSGPTIQLWRCTRNLGFNSHGCRNLIAHYAETDFIAFFDMDMRMYAPDIARLKRKKFEEGKLYYHHAYVIPKQTVMQQPGHRNCFILGKETFWKAGGYDESFTGHHFGDKEFIERVLDTGAEITYTETSITLDRLGRHGIVKGDEPKTKYIDDEFFYVPLRESEVRKLKGTVKKRLNFPFIKLL